MPGKLLKGMTIDPAVAAGRMAGGEVPYYTEQDMARTISPGWFGGEPELEVFPRGSLNPNFVEGAADIAMNAPTSGLVSGALKGGVVDPSLLGVNAPRVPQTPLPDPSLLPVTTGINDYLTQYGMPPPPKVDPQQAQYDEMAAEINKAFEAQKAAPAPAGIDPYVASSQGDEIQKLVKWLQTSYKSPSGQITSEDFLVNPGFAKDYAKVLLEDPKLWASELAAAGVGKSDLDPGGFAYDPDDAVALGWESIPGSIDEPFGPASINPYALNDPSASPEMEYNKLVDWIKDEYAGAGDSGAVPWGEVENQVKQVDMDAVEKLVDVIIKNPQHWEDQLKGYGIDINQAADWVGGIPPASIPNKFPWLPAPVPSSGGILTPSSTDFRKIREELYRRGLSQDPIMEMQRLLGLNTNEGWREAVDISDRLKGLLKERPIDPYSIAVPHAVDVSRYEKRGWESKTNEMWENALKYNREAIESPFGQEFNWDQRLYRGTSSPTDQFMDPGTKYNERGLFHADRPGPASHYGRYMYPLVTRAKNPAAVDFSGKEYGASAPGPWSSGDVNMHIEGARKAGHDMLVLENLRDEDPSVPSGRSMQDQYVVFDPAIIRSPFAKFDPARRGESNLLAGFAGGINPFPFLSGQSPEEERRRQLNGY